MLSTSTGIVKVRVKNSLTNLPLENISLSLSEDSFNFCLNSHEPSCNKTSNAFAVLFDFGEDNKRAPIVIKIDSKLFYLNSDTNLQDFVENLSTLFPEIKFERDLEGSGLAFYFNAEDQVPIPISIFSYPGTNSRVMSPEGFLPFDKRYGSYDFCLTPLINCEVSLSYKGLVTSDLREIDGWEIWDEKTKTLLVAGEVDKENYHSSSVHDIVYAINEANLGFKARYVYDDGAPFLLYNVSTDYLQLSFNIISSSNISGVMSYDNSYYHNIDYNPSTVYPSDTSIAFCLSPPSCFTTVNELVLKKPTVDYLNKEILLTYIVESPNNNNYMETFTILYYDYLPEEPETTYDVDYARIIFYRFEDYFTSYSQLSYENKSNVDDIGINNCIDSRGDVQFELRMNGYLTITNPVDLYITEDRGLTFIRVQVSPSNDKNLLLNQLASQLAAYGYTAVTSAANNKITLKKLDVKSVTVITSGYQQYSYSVNSQDWGYDGSFNIDGESRDSVLVRPYSCTLGIKDPTRNLEGFKITFEGHPSEGEDSPTKITLIKTEPGTLLNHNALDFLTVFTDVDSFEFETCGIKISAPS